MERLKHIKNTLVSCVESQIGDLSSVNAEELGEVVDMVKDMEEAIYYCTITKAMEENKEKEKYQQYQQPVMYYHETRYPEYYRDMDRNYGKMYYSGGQGGNSGGRGGNSGNSSSDRSTSYYGGYGDYPMEVRDYREGRSPMSRRNYMETKEMHQGSAAQMKELEKYMKELSQDITEMIEDASPEEKTLLQQKLNTLANKIK